MKATSIDPASYDFRHELPRSCGTCAMCCLVQSVAEMEPQKLAGTWCKFCKPGKAAACTIYETRPEPCRTFKCSWLEGIGGPELKPDKTHCVFTASMHPTIGEVMRCNVDPKRPNAWEQGATFAFIQYLVAIGNVVFIQIGDVDHNRGRMHIACPQTRIKDTFKHLDPVFTRGLKPGQPLLLRDVQAAKPMAHAFLKENA